MDKLIEVPTFVCEICGLRTPITCEGSYPNVCADCCPLDDEEWDDGANEPLYSTTRRIIDK